MPAIDKQDEIAILRHLSEIGESLTRPTILLPTDDEAAIFAAEHADRLRPYFVLAPVAPGLPRAIASKRGLSEHCIQHGIPTPKTVYARTISDVVSFAVDARFPIVIKNSEPWIRISAPAVASTTVVGSREKLYAIAEAWKTDPQIILQEYIPAEFAEDWIFHAYYDRHAKPLVAFTGRKYRSWPPQGGVTTSATALRNEQLLTMAAQFCQVIGYRGIVDMDWRLDLRDGKYKLVDFNPRIGANFRLFVTETDVDVVRAEHLDLTGRTVPISPQVFGRRFIVENLDFASCLAGGSGSSRNVKPTRPHQEIEYAWLASDDLHPFFVMVLCFGGQVLRRLWSALLGKATILTALAKMKVRYRPRTSVNR
jgi:D-aspartate ligase